jgi:hypothetical protein
MVLLRGEPINRGNRWIKIGKRNAQVSIRYHLPPWDAPEESK